MCSEEEASHFVHKKVGGKEEEATHHEVKEEYCIADLPASLDPKAIDFLILEPVGWAKAAKEPSEYYTEEEEIETPF